eukprot:GHVR01173395.1.p1 GENE.GHVR01173395.1~~GHVR01173395.1.p1  ORF type:complete len:117 (-),score=21.51 GHVR01173395.1:154-504(-)
MGGKAIIALVLYKSSLVIVITGVIRIFIFFRGHEHTRCFVDTRTHTCILPHPNCCHKTPRSRTRTHTFSAVSCTPACSHTHRHAHIDIHSCIFFFVVLHKLALLIHTLVVTHTFHT